MNDEIMTWKRIQGQVNLYHAAVVERLERVPWHLFSDNPELLEMTLKEVLGQVNVAFNNGCIRITEKED